MITAAPEGERPGTLPDAAPQCRQGRPHRGWSVEEPSNEVRWSAEIFEIVDWADALEPDPAHGIAHIDRDPDLVAAADSASGSS